MSNPNNGGAKLSLKVVTNKEKTKVLFAEGNSDFINVLLSFLVLPLGKVASILRKHNGEAAAAIGSLNTLYTGLCNLDEAYFSVRGAKQMLLNPRCPLGSECATLALDITDSLSNNNLYFVCHDQNCFNKSVFRNVSLYSDIAKCECGEPLSREIRVGKCLDGEAFVTSASSFIITDDLSFVPMTGIIQTLTNLGIAGMEVAEMETVTFGFNEIRDLLMFFLTSETPLTDTIIKKRQTSSSAAKPEPEILSHHIQKDDANTRKMVMKVCLQRSTNRFLFAVATYEFVDLLFSFLTLPLGGVEFLLGGKTGLKSIDNLYSNVANVIDDEYFKSLITKSRLINPKLPHGYISKNQFLPLSEEDPPKLRCQKNYNYHRMKEEYCLHEKNGNFVSLFKLNNELYVKKQTMCIVTDDLTFSPSLAASLSIVSSLGIPLSDVKEMELQVGLEEALSILKASLTSKTALTDGLINPMLNKQLKLERKRKQEH